VVLGCALLLSDAPRQAAGHRGPLTVVYVGAEDCGPCRTWQRDERPAFRASSEFTRLRYREVVVPYLRSLLTAQEWPDDFSELRERVKSRPGTPQWFVMRDGNVLASDAGLSAWRRAIWPAIRAQVRYDPALVEAYDELDISPVK
jgi:hypothetical protein